MFVVKGFISSPMLILAQELLVLVEGWIVRHDFSVQAILVVIELPYTADMLDDSAVASGVFYGHVESKYKAIQLIFCIAIDATYRLLASLQAAHCRDSLVDCGEVVKHVTDPACHGDIDRLVARLGNPLGAVFVPEVEQVSAKPSLIDSVGCEVVPKGGRGTGRARWYVAVRRSFWILSHEETG